MVARKVCQASFGILLTLSLLALFLLVWALIVQVVDVFIICGYLSWMYCQEKGQRGAAYDRARITHSARDRSTRESHCRENVRWACFLLLSILLTFCKSPCLSLISSFHNIFKPVWTPKNEKVVVGKDYHFSNFLSRWFDLILKSYLIYFLQQVMIYIPLKHHFFLPFEEIIL